MALRQSRRILQDRHDAKSHPAHETCETQGMLLAR
jgi:hypothetical protein